MEATISRDSVILVHNGQEHKMPSLAELRSNYNRDNRDLGTYLRMGKQALITSKLRGYDFQENVDFFPGRTESMIHTQEGSISSNIGFFTRVYFKNPGFEEGDIITIKVSDKDDPSISGSIEIILKDRWGEKEK